MDLRPHTRPATPDPTLAQWVAGDRRAHGAGLPVAFVGPIVAEIAAHLDSLHAQGQTHGDVRPTRIAVPLTGPAYLLPAPPGLAATGAPDDDIAGLAAAAFFALNGTAPDEFAPPAGPRAGPSPGPYPFLMGLHRSRAPVGLLDVLARGLSPRPAERYASAGAFAHALRAAAPMPKAPTPRASLLRAAAPRPAPDARAPAPPAAGALPAGSRPPSPSRAGGLRVLGGAALLALGIGIGRWIPASPPPPEPAALPLRAASARPVSPAPPAALPAPGDALPPVPPLPIPAADARRSSRPRPAPPVSAPQTPPASLRPVPPAGPRPPSVARLAHTRREGSGADGVPPESDTPPPPDAPARRRASRRPLAPRRPGPDDGPAPPPSLGGGGLRVYARQALTLEDALAHRFRPVRPQRVLIDGRPSGLLTAGRWMPLPPGWHRVAFYPTRGVPFDPNLNFWVRLGPGRHSLQVPLPRRAAPAAPPVVTHRDVPS